MKILFAKIIMVLTLAVFISCSSNQPRIDDFNTSFIGSIKNEDTLCLSISKNNNTLGGRCSVKGEKQPLKVSGAINETGMMIFNTFDFKGAMVGSFEASIKDSALVGKFTRPGSYKSSTFSLTTCLTCDSVFVTHKDTLTIH